MHPLEPQPATEVVTRSHFPPSRWAVILLGMGTWLIYGCFLAAGFVGGVLFTLYVNARGRVTPWR